MEPVAGFPEGIESAWTAVEQNELADFLKQLKEDNATQVKILLTSRRDEQKWLGGIPHRVPMLRMSLADAASLAFRLGKEKGIKRAEIAAWQPLLDYCAGNPFTLRVVAGQAMKRGLRGKKQIEQFIQAVRDGEQGIEDADEAEGRDKSLTASLNYGFLNAFNEDELPVISLLHLFQGTVVVEVLEFMGKAADPALPEVQGKSKEHLTSILRRASDIGLLTHLVLTWYSIHPALPWFLRKLFAEHYNGRGRRSTAETALRAWVVAVGKLGIYYHDQFLDGKRGVIQFLALEEANLLHARRIARGHRWWPAVIGTMQGLRCLYEYQGRGVEWARLVTEIVADFSTDDDAPVPGLEDFYVQIMEYRVGLILNLEHDLTRAIALQERLVGWARRQAATALALSEDAPLDQGQRHFIRNLGAVVFQLGAIISEQGSGQCVRYYDEANRCYKRVKEVAGESICHFNLGNAYLQIPDIRDVDAAEAEYQRALNLCDPHDALGRSRCIDQIGLVHRERFEEARRRGEPSDTLLRHWQVAEQHSQQALALCPPSAIVDLATVHAHLGNLYSDFGKMEVAQAHIEKALEILQPTGDRCHTGKLRHNMAAVYGTAAHREKLPARKRDLFLRSQDYARAALRDFQHYQCRCAADEAKARKLLDDIEEDLVRLPE
ncbi:MAG: hypothetical protein ACLP5H_02750 [Desulfomonilaceae bacterium]